MITFRLSSGKGWGREEGGGGGKRRRRQEGGGRRDFAGNCTKNLNLPKYFPGGAGIAGLRGFSSLNKAWGPAGKAGIPSIIHCLRSPGFVVKT